MRPPRSISDSPTPPTHTRGSTPACRRALGTLRQATPPTPCAESAAHVPNQGGSTGAAAGVAAGVGAGVGAGVAVGVATGAAAGVASGRHQQEAGISRGPSSRRRCKRTDTCISKTDPTRTRCTTKRDVVGEHGRMLVWMAECSSGWLNARLDG
eukprot:350742-Chlamydomonas_euryale.AAC.1